MSAVIMGTRGCGKSTVLGLLHQAMTIHTNTRPGVFRFYIKPNDLNRLLQNTTHRMLRGEFPAYGPANKDDISILLGFKPKSRALFRAWKNNLWTFAGEGFNFKGLGMLLRVYDVSGEAINQYSTAPNIDIFLKVNEIFDSNILILLIDCKKFTNTTRGDKWETMLQFDRACARIVNAYLEYRRRNKQKEKIYPIYLFTKLDEMDGEIKKEFRVEQIESAKKYEEKVCGEIGNALLQRYMSTTRAVIEAHTTGFRAHRVSVEREKYFFSWVGIEKIEGIATPETQRLKVIQIEDENGARFQNDFPLFMYEAMLEYIVHIGEKEGGDSPEVLNALFHQIAYF